LNSCGGLLREARLLIYHKQKTTTHLYPGRDLSHTTPSKIEA
jgi:hypothetical protein